MMCSIRPSSLGLFSVTAMSCVASTILFSIFQPSSVCAISRPLKRTVTLALWPSSMNRRTCLSLKSKSCFSVFGPILTSLTRIVVCFLRASFSRRACVYLYLPKSMMRHTGGCASGATSTRSSSCCRAVSSACWMGMTPSCAPSAPTTRTSRTRIPSLIRISFAWLIDALLVVSRRIRRAGQGGPAARSRTAHGETGRARADHARVVLGEHPDEPLEGAEDRAVDHDGALRRSVGVDVLEREAVGLREVDLDGRELPAAPERVQNVDVDFGPVERSVARVEVIREPIRLQRVVQGPLGRLPLLVRPHRFRRPRRELEEGVEREGLVPVANQFKKLPDLVLELIGAAVDVRIVLRELPHAEETRQRARALVPVQPAHVGEAQREVAVRPERVTINERGLRAVHGLEAEDLLFRLHEEHVLAEVLPVARLLPELLVDEDRRRDLLVAARIERLADEPLQLAHQGPAVREPERRARRHLVEDKEVQLAPELAVVALLRLLQAPDVAIELLLREPRGPVDPLEHRVPLVAAPVGARRREQLEVLHVARRGHVRPTAEVDELPLAVERHARGVDPLEDLDLVGLGALAEEADGVRTAHLLALEGIVGLRDLAHDRFDPREVLGREGLGLPEVVVEAVLDRGPDRQLHVGEEALHGLGHDVRGGMAERRERRGIAVELAGQLEVALFFRQGFARPGW